MELFRRFPKFGPLSHGEQQLVPLDERKFYPALSKDFATLDEELMPYFRKRDNEALSGQNRYRWMYIILIFGGAATTILGIVQLASTEIPWIGLIGAIVAGIVAVATTVLQTFEDHKRYLKARLVAERLRSEYFLFLGHCGQYANEQDRTPNLLQNITDITAKEDNI